MAKAKKAQAPAPMTREDLLARRMDPGERVHTYDVPHGLGRICLLRWGGPGLDAWDAWKFECADEADPDDPYPYLSRARGRMFISTVCDPQGNLLFSREDLEDVEAMDPRLLEFVYQNGWTLNGQHLGRVDALEGKSAATSGSDSATD